MKRSITSFLFICTKDQRLGLYICLFCQQKVRFYIIPLYLIGLGYNLQILIISGHISGFIGYLHPNNLEVRVFNYIKKRNVHVRIFCHGHVHFLYTSWYLGLYFLHGRISRRGRLRPHFKIQFLSIKTSYKC